MAERLKAQLWRSCVAQVTLGSNPSLSASKNRGQGLIVSIIIYWSLTPDNCPLHLLAVLDGEVAVPSPVTEP